MKYLDCNQIKIFINLEIIGEEIFFLNLKFFKNLCNLVKPIATTTTSKPNFYYILELCRAMHGLIINILII